ncbi:UNVERIFIED_CONTAM: high-affinity nickel-transport protein [Williamsia faeni]
MDAAARRSSSIREINDVTIIAESSKPLVGPWSRAEHRRLAGILGSILFLHILGVVLYLGFSGSPATGGGIAGSGLLAYMLGMRHAFDADHIAAIDDTTRIMLLRGRRPVGVGFFFAMGHSTVVLILALLVALGGAVVKAMDLTRVQQVGGYIAMVIAVIFLVLVSTMNSVVLRELVMLSKKQRAGHDISDELEHNLSHRGFMARMLGGRLRGLIRSSWHMYPVGLLMGLGLETASEVSLLALTAAASTTGHLSWGAILSLPILFAAGMSTFDTADSLVMTRAYSWSNGSPVRRLRFNTLTTGATVAIGFFVAGIYICGLLYQVRGFGWLAPVGAMSDNFEILGYAIAGTFVVIWGSALVVARRSDASDSTLV